MTIVAVLGAADYADSITQVAPATNARPRGASYRKAADVQHVQKQLTRYPLGVISGLAKTERQALMRCETFNGARVQLVCPLARCTC